MTPAVDTGVSPQDTTTERPMTSDYVGEFVEHESTELLTAAAELLQSELLGFEVVEVALLANNLATVSYDCSLSWTQLGRDPIVSTERIVVLIGHGDLSELSDAGIAVFEYGDLQVGVWRYPFDPRLPSLPAVLLGQGEFSRLQSIDLHSYRPMKRAVVSAVNDDGRQLFIKLMEPYRVTRTVRNHSHLRSHGVSVPPAWTAESAPDVLVTEAVVGTPFVAMLAEAATEGQQTDAGYAQSERTRDVVRSILDQVDRIQGTPIEVDFEVVRPARRQPIRDLPMRVGQLLSIDRTTANILRQIEAAIGTEDSDKSVLVHGDFHPGQLFIEMVNGVNGVTTQVIDLDDVGYGHPLDDVSLLLAHLMMHARHGHEQGIATMANDFLVELQDQLAWRGVDEHELLRRTAAHLVGLVIGSYRTQEDDWQTRLHRELGAIAELLQTHEIPHEETLT